MSEKNKNFRRLAEKRVNNALRYIRLIGNLSNTNNYEFDEAEVKQVFDVLEAELRESRALFRKKLQKDKEKSGVRLFDRS